MITVKVQIRDKVVAEAECETPETALLAARTLWDETWSEIAGHKNKRIIFSLGNDTIRVLEDRP